MRCQLFLECSSANRVFCFSSTKVNYLNNLRNQEMIMLGAETSGQKEVKSAGKISFLYQRSSRLTCERIIICATQIWEALQFAHGEHHNLWTRFQGQVTGIFTCQFLKTSTDHLSTFCVHLGLDCEAKNLLVHVWASETGRIHPQLTGPCFETYEDANAFTLSLNKLNLWKTRRRFSSQTMR